MDWISNDFLFLRAPFCSRSMGRLPGCPGEFFLTTQICLSFVWDDKQKEIHCSCDQEKRNVKSAALMAKDNLGPFFCVFVFSFGGGRGSFITGRPQLFVCPCNRPTHRQSIRLGGVFSPAPLLSSLDQALPVRPSPQPGHRRPLPQFGRRLTWLAESNMIWRWRELTLSLFKTSCRRLTNGSPSEGDLRVVALDMFSEKVWVSVKALIDVITWAYRM